MVGARHGIQRQQEQLNPMQSALEGARRGTLLAKLTDNPMSCKALHDEIMAWLDDAKAENLVSIDLAGKTSFGDYMIVATGRTDRHVGAIADQIARKLKETDAGRVRIEGMDACDWVLVDIGSIIIHIFRPEVRTFYNLEKMWLSERPPESGTH